jgi:L-fuculose-phosphate aldolase
LTHPDPRYEPSGLSLIHAGRQLRAYGLLSGLEGNLSLRLPNGDVMITATGVRKDRLTPADLIILSPAGEQTHGLGKPSSELALHLALYSAEQTVSAIIHTHPPIATAFAVARRVPVAGILAESAALLGGVALVPYHEPGSGHLGQSAGEALQSARAQLLAGHGAVTVGVNIQDALVRMELLEKLCEIQLSADILGGAKSLTSDEVEALRNPRAKLN